MRILILTIIVIALNAASVARQNPKAELQHLSAIRGEFINATEEYKASLASLKAFYERDGEQDRVNQTNEQIAAADGLIRDALDDVKFHAAYNRALSERRTQRKAPCKSWAVVAYYRSAAEANYSFECH